MVTSNLQNLDFGQYAYWPKLAFWSILCKFDVIGLFVRSILPQVGPWIPLWLVQFPKLYLFVSFQPQNEHSVKIGNFTCEFEGIPWLKRTCTITLWGQKLLPWSVRLILANTRIGQIWLLDKIFALKCYVGFLQCLWDVSKQSYTKNHHQWSKNHSMQTYGSKDQKQLFRPMQSAKFLLTPTPKK